MEKGIIRDQRLAAIVAEEIGLILGSARDWRLSELTVTRVEAVRGGKRFFVYVAPDEGSPVHPWEEIKVALDAAQGFLRSSLTTAVNLKRAPELSFVLDPLWLIARGVDRG